ncbi:MAG: glycosyltransferase [Flavisolibacter sp.]|nr:glycosyltransferase [Flavisolibacter sp.]
MVVRAGDIVFYSFVAVALAQVFYYLWFFSRLAFYRPSAKQQSQTHPVSVIISARDEDENLARNLPGILVQQYPTTHEVIVVNDNSQDDTKYILAELQKKFKQLQVIELTQEAKHIAGKKYPLSVGIKEARYEIVLLTDADCVPASEHWIAKVQDAFTDGKELVLGYGAYYKQPGLLNKLIRWETFHTALQYLSYALAGVPYMGVGRNLAYRKELFFRNKGFSNISHIPSGDDDLFVNKVATKENTAIVIDLDTFTSSQPETIWKDWVRQKTRHYSTGKYYKAKHKFLLGVYTLSLILFYPLFIDSFFFYTWWWVLLPFGVRLLVQAVVLKKTMQKLNEADLYPWLLLLDLWMPVYYFIFASALWKKPGRNW